MRGPCGVVAAVLLQLSPASSFGAAPLTRPPFNSGSSRPDTTATHGAASFGQNGALTPLGAKAGPFSSPARSRRDGHAGGALFAGGSKDGDVREEPTPKKSSIPGGMGGWDWGFTSTSKKTTPKTPAVEPKKPVFSADDEAAEIEAVKRKAAAEIKAEQEEAKGKKAAKMAVADAPETDAELEEADEIAEIKARAAAEVEAEKEKEKATAPAAKKPDTKKMPAETRPAKPDEISKAADGPPKTEPVTAESAKAEPAKAATPAKSPPKKSSGGGGGFGGWDWGFTPSTKSTAAKSKPTAAPATTKTEKPKEAEAKKEAAAAAAASAAAAAAKEEKAAAAKAAQEKAEKEKAEKAEREKAEKEKADKEKAEKEKAEKAKAEKAKAEKAAAKAAQEKRAEEIAATATDDVPEPKAKKAAAEPATTDAKKDAKDKAEEVAPGDAKAKEDKKKPAEPKKKEPEKPAAKKNVGMWGMAPREVAAPSSLMLTKPETVVVVTGATGRVGSLAVRRLLELYPKVLVRAVVNDLSKGNRLLKEEKDKYGIKLEIISAELGGKRSAAKVVEGASAVVFCASGFAQNLSPIQRLANAVRLTINPSSVADVEGVRDVALALKETKKIVLKASNAKQDAKEGQDEPQPLSPNAPRFVLLSSAAVTRPNWSAEEKELYPLAADVPIVKLNPLNILTVKAEGEKELRQVGIPYTVVRPCGLNDDHPRGRPLFSVGDTAAGRICREDVADVLVRCLGTKEATGKTFEVQALPGFEKVAASNPKSNKGGIDQALSSLPTDEALTDDPELLQNYRRFSYPVLTQLRPVPLAQTPKDDD